MSAAVAALIAHGAFWLLLVYGWATDQVSVRGAGMFVAAWLGARLALPYLPYAPAAGMFSSVVAVLDVVLVFVIFKGDIRIT